MPQSPVTVVILCTRSSPLVTTLALYSCTLVALCSFTLVAADARLPPPPEITHVRLGPVPVAAEDTLPQLRNADVLVAHDVAGLAQNPVRFSRCPVNDRQCRNRGRAREVDRHDLVRSGISSAQDLITPLLNSQLRTTPRRYTPSASDCLSPQPHQTCDTHSGRYSSTFSLVFLLDVALVADAARDHPAGCASMPAAALQVSFISSLRSIDLRCEMPYTSARHTVIQVRRITEPLGVHMRHAKFLAAKTAKVSHPATFKTRNPSPIKRAAVEHGPFSHPNSIRTALKG